MTWSRMGRRGRLLLARRFRRHRNVIIQPVFARARLRLCLLFSNHLLCIRISSVAHLGSGSRRRAIGSRRRHRSRSTLLPEQHTTDAIARQSERPGNDLHDDGVDGGIDEVGADRCQERPQRERRHPLGDGRNNGLVNTLVDIALQQVAVDDRVDTSGQRHDGTNLQQEQGVAMQRGEQPVDALNDRIGAHFQRLVDHAGHVGRAHQRPRDDLGDNDDADGNVVEHEVDDEVGGDVGDTRGTFANGRVDARHAPAEAPAPFPGRVPQPGVVPVDGANNGRVQARLSEMRTGHRRRHRRHQPEHADAPHERLRHRRRRRQRRRHGARAGRQRRRTGRIVAIIVVFVGERNRQQQDDKGTEHESGRAMHDARAGGCEPMTLQTAIRRVGRHLRVCVCVSACETLTAAEMEN